MKVPRKLWLTLLAKFGRPSVFCHVRVPRQAIAGRRVAAIRSPLN